jgi:hypothetical protein
VAGGEGSVTFPHLAGRPHPRAEPPASTASRSSAPSKRGAVRESGARQPIYASDRGLRTPCPVSRRESSSKPRSASSDSAVGIVGDARQRNSAGAGSRLRASPRRPAHPLPHRTEPIPAHPGSTIALDEIRGAARPISGAREVIASTHATSGNLASLRCS